MDGRRRRPLAMRARASRSTSSAARIARRRRYQARDDRVSLTIDHDTPQVMEIKGLSMAARAQVVADPAEAQKVLGLLMLKYPKQKVNTTAYANARGCPHIPRDAHGDLCARLLQGLRTHRSRHLLGPRPMSLAPGRSWSPRALSRPCRRSRREDKRCRGNKAEKLLPRRRFRWTCLRCAGARGIARIRIREKSQFHVW